MAELADAFDPEPDGLARLEEAAAAHAHAGGSAGEDQIAGLERHSRGEVGDLLGGREDHLARVRTLHQLVSDPELHGELLGIGDLAGGRDPRAEGTGALEAFLAEPVELERGGVGHVRAAHRVARGEIVGNPVTGHVFERIVDAHVPRGTSDHGGRGGRPPPEEANVGYALELALRDFGDLHIVVCCAGILRERMIFNMSEDEWDAVIAVHLKGHFTVMQPATRHMREKKFGSIITFTSTAGLEGSPDQPNYSAAKEGIVGLTRSTALAMARYGVRCNASSRRAPRGRTDRAGRGHL